MSSTARYPHWMAFLIGLWLLLVSAPTRAGDQPDYTEAIAATQEGFDAAKATAEDTKAKLEKALETYKTIKDYVSGAKGTELIDKLYQSRGIEDHTKITELRGKLQEVLRKLDQAGLESKIEHANKILDQFGTIAGGASDAVKFMERFNPEGARGDPTRGLRIIGAAIDDAAGGLPYPMNEIFKEYAKAATTFSKRLDDLSKKINENTRQGSLGGSYSGYAEAQEFFEKNFEGKDGRTSTTFMDVSSQFPLLGKTVQVFQDIGSNRGDYYVFSLDDARGSIVPPAFETVYRYFAALPDVTAIPPDQRVSVLTARATSNTLTDQIAEAERLRGLFDAARVDKEPLLRVLNVWDTMGVLLMYGGDAFVGFFLLIPEKHSEIERVRAALEDNVFVTGNVVDANDQAAPDVTVKLDVTGKGSGQALTSADGGYVVVSPGKPGDAFRLTAGPEGAAEPKEGTFDDRRMFRRMDFKLASELQIVRIFVVDKKTEDPLAGATVTLGESGARDAPDGLAVFELPIGAYTGSASAPKHTSKGFQVIVGTPVGLKRAVGQVWDRLPGFAQGALRLAGKVVPSLTPEIALRVSLEGDGSEEDAGSDAGDAGDAGEDDGKFKVGLSAPKTTLDLGERVTVAAATKGGTPPFSFTWSIDGLAMPARGEGGMPIAFGKLGHHFVGVTVTDSSSPPGEAAATIDLVVGKMNDPDLVGRWEGTATVLEFKSDMPEVDAASRGKSGPGGLWIAPDGAGGLRAAPSGGQGYFCHPAEKVVRDANSLRVIYDGVSPLPQNEFWSILAKCEVDLTLVEGRLKGLASVSSSATLSMPNNPPFKSSSYMKASYDFGRVSANPGPPPVASGPRSQPGAPAPPAPAGGSPATPKPAPSKGGP